MTEARPDFEAEGLLEGVEGRAREARLRLLNRLFDGGIGLEELREAVAHNRLVILPAEQALGSDARFSARQLSERAGVPLDFFLAVRRAQGLALSDADVLRQHTRERLRHQAVSQAMLEAGELPGTREMAVAFADMVAFTRLGEELAPEEVGGIAGRLGELASECVRPPVRLVKMIGDAAMLVAPDAQALLGSTLELVAAGRRDGGPPAPLRGRRLRSGARSWYGRPVNVAESPTSPNQGRWSAHKSFVMRPARSVPGAPSGPATSRGSKATSSYFAPSLWWRPEPQRPLRC